MRNLSTSLLQFLLSAALLRVQFAGSSPALHEFLHGKIDHPPPCCDHQDPEREAPPDPAGNTCNDGCAVMLMADGLALAQPLVLREHWQVSIKPYTTFADDVHIAQYRRWTEARAPPVQVFA